MKTFGGDYCGGSKAGNADWAGFPEKEQHNLICYNFASIG